MPNAPSEAMGSEPRFMDLLRQLAEEHTREVQRLHAEVSRLQQVCDEMSFSNQHILRSDSEQEGPDEIALSAAFIVAKEVHKSNKRIKQAKPRADNGIDKEPDQEALEAALGLASLGTKADADVDENDSFPMQDVDAIVPADDVPCTAPVSGTTRKNHNHHAHFATSVLSLDEECDDSAMPGELPSFDGGRITVKPLKECKEEAQDRQVKSVWTPVVLEYWGRLINAVRKKQAIDALPGLGGVWKQLSEDPYSSGSRGALQLDMLVQRATHLNLGSTHSLSNGSSRGIVDRICKPDSCVCRSWRKSILHPTCRRRVCWDTCGIVLLLHDLVFIPMQVFNTGTGGMPKEYESFLHVLDFVGASFWSIDIVVSFRTGFYSAEGFVELRPWPVAQHYIKSWLPMDLVIVCTDWCTMFLGMSSAAGFMRIGKSISRFMRVLRLLRFFKMNRLVIEITERINSEYILTVMGLMKTLVLIVVINHYIACAWYGLGRMGLISRWPDRFLVNYPDSFGYAYTTSLHWSLTQFTPASMEVVPQNSIERFFVIGVIIVALVAFSSFVSSITAAMTHIRQINAQKMQLESKIRQFFADHKISHAMASRVWHFLKRNKIGKHKRLKQVDIPAFKMLPERIKEDLRLEIYLPTLNVHPLFSEYSKRESIAMLKICNEALDEKSLAVGEELWREVDEVQEMLFVVYGALLYHEQLTPLDLSDEYPENPLEVHTGQWACEISLWADKTNLPGVFMALTGGSELVLLKADRFQSIASSFHGTVSFLVKYATFFMDGFKAVSTDMHSGDNASESDILFNSMQRAEDLVNMADGTRRKSHRRKTNMVTDFFSLQSGGRNSVDRSEDSHTAATWRSSGVSAEGEDSCSASVTGSSQL